MLVNIENLRYAGPMTSKPGSPTRTSGVRTALPVISPRDDSRSAAPARPGLDPDVRLLSALADPVRLAIVRQLAACGSVCACDLDACSWVSQPTVSHHLRVLREAGVVRAERRGTWIYYSLEPAALERLVAVVRSVIPDGASPLPLGSSGVSAVSAASAATEPSPLDPSRPRGAAGRAAS